MHPRLRHPFNDPAHPRPIAAIPPARAALAGPRRPLNLRGQLDLAHFPGQAERAAIPGISEGLYLTMQTAYNTHSFHYKDGHNPEGSIFIYETSVIPRHAVSFNMANLYIPELPNPIIQLYPGTTGLLRNIEYQMDLQQPGGLQRQDLPPCKTWISPVCPQAPTPLLQQLAPSYGYPCHATGHILQECTPSSVSWMSKEQNTQVPMLHPPERFGT